MEDDWRAAVPDDAPPFFLRVHDDGRHGVDVLGRDDEGLFCIDDDEHDRSVWWISRREPGQPRRFVNSSVEHFRDSMETFFATWRLLPGLPADEVARTVSRLRRDLAQIEPAVPPEATAIQLPGYVEESQDYWQVVLGRVENRLH